MTFNPDSTVTTTMQITSQVQFYLDQCRVKYMYYRVVLC